MAELIETGRIIELILLVLIAEGALLIVLAMRRRLGVGLPALLLNLAAGAFLLLGLRAVMIGAEWVEAGAWLGAAGLAHAGDLVLRIRK